MADATHRSGTPIMINHTAASAIAAGEVLVAEDAVRIAHQPIAAGRVGAMAARGGVYSCTADAAIDNGRKLYWDAGNSKVSINSSAGARKLIGEAGSTAAADGDAILVVHYS